METAQVLLTLHTVVNPQNIQNLVVEHIAALLDDLLRGHDPSQRGKTAAAMSLHLNILMAAYEAPQAADHYRRLHEAVREVEGALGRLRLEAVTIEALDKEARSSLGLTISNVKEAFRKLALAGGSDVALQDELGRMLQEIGGIRGDLDVLGDMRVTDTSPDLGSFNFPMVSSRLVSPPSVADETRHVGWSLEDYRGPGLDPFGP
jgi:hypothetical protein